MLVVLRRLGGIKNFPYLLDFSGCILIILTILDSSESSLTALLRAEYDKLSIPRSTKKAVEKAHSGEVLGAWIDGVPNQAKLANTFLRWSMSSKKKLFFKKNADAGRSSPFGVR